MSMPLKVQGMGGSGFSSTKAANSAVESADDLQKMHLHGSTIDTGVEQLYLAI